MATLLPFVPDGDARAVRLEIVALGDETLEPPDGKRPLELPRCSRSRTVRSTPAKRAYERR